MISHKTSKSEISEVDSSCFMSEGQDLVNVWKILQQEVADFPQNLWLLFVKIYFFNEKFVILAQKSLNYMTVSILQLYVKMLSWFFFSSKNKK